MEKIDIKSMTRPALEKELKKLGAEGYRAAQIFKWLYQRDAEHLGDMTDIPQDLRAKLKKHFHMTHPVIVDSKRSIIDGTTKYLLKRAADPLLPPDIIGRKKKGFGSPIGPWLRSPAGADGQAWLMKAARQLDIWKKAGLIPSEPLLWALLFGAYRVSVAVFDKGHVRPYVWHNQLHGFSIVQDVEDHGLVHIPHEWGVLTWHEP